MARTTASAALSSAGAALLQTGADLSDLRLLSLEASPTEFSQPFRERYPDRCLSPGTSVGESISAAAESAANGKGPVVVAGSAELLAVQGLGPFRRAVVQDRRPVKLVVTDGGWSSTAPAVLEDVALLRGLPGITVVVPGDAATSAAATGQILRSEGPGYLRLSPDLPDRAGDAPFELGRVRQLRDGRDLTLLASGQPVALAIHVAEELARVGIDSRVLDCASLAPLDEKAILRAARDTGALLTLEEHQVATGLGALVAAVAAENAPVPVRRLGALDLLGPPGEPAGGRAAMGLTLEDALEEAWELLRLKGKVQ